MGTSNFASSDFATLGMTSKTYTSEVVLAQYRLDNLEGYENDPDDIWYKPDDEVREHAFLDAYPLVIEYYDETQKLTDVLNNFIHSNYGINPLAEFQTQLVKFELERGYHGGFRIAIHTECDELEHWYDYNHPHSYGYNGELPAGMSFEQFKNCYYKVLDFCQYTLAELATLIPLTGVSGGGEYTHQPNNDDQHKQFSSAFALLMRDIKRAKLVYS